MILDYQMRPFLKYQKRREEGGALRLVSRRFAFRNHWEGVKISSTHNLAQGL